MYSTHGSGVEIGANVKVKVNVKLYLREGFEAKPAGNTPLVYTAGLTIEHDDGMYP